MKVVISFFVCLFLYSFSYAQEMNCTVTIDAEQTGRTKLSIFKTLESAVEEFVNNTTWADLDLDNDEKINCNIFINVSEYDSDNFNATIQVQSSRPVFGSTMNTPILNFKDNDFNFSYTEFQPLNYNPNSYDSNLVSTISFYVYTILGLDADTFELEGGTPYFEEAEQIVNNAQQGNSSGWKASGGNRSRYRLNNDILSNNFVKFREALYTYHREGLDAMHEDVEVGKEKIVDAVKMLKEVNNSRPNSLLMRSFFDAKASEVEKIFSGGPEVSITEITDDLNKIAPMHSKNWRNISN